MSFLQQLNVVYRDLKPDNVMLKPMPNSKSRFACLIDWTFANQNSTMMSTPGAHPVFAAPEVKKGIRPYTAHIDVYSFGKMLLAMLACTTQKNVILNNAQRLSRDGKEACGANNQRDFTKRARPFLRYQKS